MRNSLTRSPRLFTSPVCPRGETPDAHVNDSDGARVLQAFVPAREFAGLPNSQHL